MKSEFLRWAIYILGVRDGVDRGRAAWELTRVSAEKMKGANWFENILVSGEGDELQGARRLFCESGRETGRLMDSIQGTKARVD